jgi:hypothetical protein
VVVVVVGLCATNGPVDSTPEPSLEQRARKKKARIEFLAGIGGMRCCCWAR